MPHIKIRNAAGQIVGSINDEAGTTEISKEWAETKPAPEMTAEESALEETLANDGSNDTPGTA